jgi:oligopeptide transport system substrate-binding protein
VLAKGNAWARPENYVANGPYIPTEWVPNDHVTLVKNPRFYDAANVRIKTIIYKPSADTLAALKSIRSGELDTQNLIPFSEITWMHRHIPHTLQLNTYLSVAYVTPNEARKPFQDVRMREVIALAYDREIMTEKIIRLGEPPAYHFVPPGIAGYPAGAHLPFQNLSSAQRIARARMLMAQMGYGPDNHFHTTFDSSTSPDSKRQAAAYQAMLKNVYIDVDIVNSDTQIFYRKLQQGQFDIAPGIWIGDFDDPGTFLDLLRGGHGDNWGNNYGRYNNPRYDALLDKANQTLDLKTRGELLRQAEQMALNDFAVSPSRFNVTQDIVEPYVKGWIPNVRDFNKSRWLWIDPHARPERGE